MKTITKIFLSLSLLAVLAGGVYVAMPVHAATLAEQIAALQNQIAVLQTRLQELMGQQNNPPATWCYNFDRNLKFDNNGSAVAALQIALSREGLYTQNNTGTHFDERLASAVVTFQQKYATEILTPSSLTNGTGFVGAATRVKLNALYGCNKGQGNNHIVINSIAGPTTLNVNQMGTWAVNASSNNSNNLTYSVNWGDQTIVPPPMAASLPDRINQTATFTHSYSSAGNYVATFTVADSRGNVATRTLTIVIGTQTNGAPTANNQSISVNKNASVLITLTGSDPQNSPLNYVLVSVPVHGSVTGNVPNLTYTPNLNFSGSDSFMFKVNDGSLDSNTATVSITVNPVSNIQPVINSLSGPQSIFINQTGTWTINAFENGASPLTYSVSWGDEATMGMMSNSPISILNQGATFTHTYTTAGSYVATFHVTDNNGNTATGTISVVVRNY